jgi:hypothetical protein
MRLMRHVPVRLYIQCCVYVSWSCEDHIYSSVLALPHLLPRSSRSRRQWFAFRSSQVVRIFTSDNEPLSPALGAKDTRQRTVRPDDAP